MIPVNKKITRRQFVKTTALATAAVTVGPYVKTSHSAGALKMMLWDHWIPGANDVSKKIIMDWGKTNGVDITVDYVTTVGFNLRVKLAAESRAKTGHDIVVLPDVHTGIYKNVLEPLDDVVKAIISEYGELMPDAEYLCKMDGTWHSCPGPIGSHNYPMVSRLDLWKKHAGIDLKKIFPDNPNRDPALVKTWTYEAFLEGCKKLHAAGYPFGNPIGSTSDSQDWLGPLFAAFGSFPADAKGNITFDSDETRTALEFMKKLTEVMPSEVYAWDDGSNNRFIISGRGSAIQNPPSAWRVCMRDQPKTAAQLWHHDTPAGPKGRFRGSLPFMIGLWSFSKNKSAGKDLIHHMLKKKQQQQLIEAGQGFDISLIKAFNKHPVWKNANPPAGTLYNYPIQGDEFQMMCGYPAPLSIAAQIYTQATIPNTIAKVCKGGKSIDEVIKWAVSEIEGYMRG
jgi:ABC-type glycerol-3-phosphate transport system substrate-binding protein